MFTMENKDSQIKYLNELISILESNKDFTDTIDTIKCMNFTLKIIKIVIHKIQMN